MREELIDAQRDLRAYGDTYIGWSKGMPEGHLIDIENRVGWRLPADTKWFLSQFVRSTQRLADRLTEQGQGDRSRLVIRPLSGGEPVEVAEYACEVVWLGRNRPCEERVQVARSAVGVFFQYENGTIAYERNGGEPDVVAGSFTEFVRRQWLIDSDGIELHD